MTVHATNSNSSHGRFGGHDMPARGLECIILAAGKGTRMNSDLPKVLHPVAGRPMIEWVVDAATQVGSQRTVVIVGHRGDLVREALKHRPHCVFVEQREQLGTGHAVKQARAAYPQVPDTLDVLVLCGDGPLIRARTLQQMLSLHRAHGAAATLATSNIPDPTGYGRIIRDRQGRFERIVEHRDATDSQRAIHEVNPSYYCFRADALFEALERITNHNAKGEYYLTDVFELIHNRGLTIESVDAVPPEDVLSINTPEQLAEVDALLRQRLGSETEMIVPGVQA